MGAPGNGRSRSAGARCRACSCSWPAGGKRGWDGEQGDWGERGDCAWRRAARGTRGARARREPPHHLTRGRQHQHAAAEEQLGKGGGGAAVRAVAAACRSRGAVGSRGAIGGSIVGRLGALPGHKGSRAGSGLLGRVRLESRRLLLGRGGCGCARGRELGRCCRVRRRLPWCRCLGWRRGLRFRRCLPRLLRLPGLLLRLGGRLPLLRLSGSRRWRCLGFRRGLPGCRVLAPRLRLRLRVGVGRGCEGGLPRLLSHRHLRRLWRGRRLPRLRLLPLLAPLLLLGWRAGLPRLLRLRRRRLGRG